MQPERKNIRLPDYDYSQNGAYFITICTHNRKKLFGDVGADSISARTVAEVFEEVISTYANVSCPKHVVMPDHFHALIVIERADMESAPTLSEIVQAFKRYSTVRISDLVRKGLVQPYEKKVWQRSYYDHVIRNQQDYNEIWEYIDTNPLRWKMKRQDSV
jgi:REP element-mobilizing transposase RayT